MIHMLKIKKDIEIVRSNTAGLSSLSQESSDAIFKVLSDHFTCVKSCAVDNLIDLESLVSRKPDLVFLGLEFIPIFLGAGNQNANRIWVTKYLEDNGITSTGSSQNALQLQRNKALAKQCVIDANLMTSPFCIIKQGQKPNKDYMPLTYPLFIKPLDRGGGLGIDSNSVAYNFEQLVSKVRSIASTFQSDSIIEEYLPGREFSVAILKDENAESYSVMPIELIAPKDKYGIRILSDKVKNANVEQAVEVIEGDIKRRVTALALNVFNALGARDYGRIDIRLDKNDNPHFLEANLIPSLISGYGSFPKACLLNAGISHESMIVNIAKLGLDRLPVIKYQPKVLPSFLLAPAFANDTHISI